jgi:2-polyprenyl-6-methoxyphenol hydroxylase-like FAD-dependent oxidoreductase
MSLEVIVVGGGFTGTAFAAAMAARGAKVRVFEASPTTISAFRGELIHPRGVRALDSLGLKEPLFEAGGVAVPGFAVTSAGDRPAALLPYGDDRGPGLGIEHSTMVVTMRREVARRSNVTITQGVRIVDFVHEGARVVGVKQEDGTELRADLVVVADGRASKLRPLLGLEPDIRLLSYTVVVGVKGDLLPHAGYGHVFLGAPGPILAYPYGEGLARFCIDLPVGLAKGNDAIVALLKKDYAPVVPSPLREALVEALEREPFEACATHSISTHRCASPGVALIGDAGGCGHPLTASGLTNAMNDVLTLADLLKEQGPTDKALEQYQRRRYDFIRMRELFTDALYEVFRAHDVGSKALQAGIFRYWGRSERSRTASMELLSGEELRTSRFVAEYSRVFGLSALDLVEGLTREPDLAEGSKRLRSLMATSFGRLEHVVEKTARKVVDRYRLKLHRTQGTQPSP